VKSVENSTFLILLSQSFFTIEMSVNALKGQLIPALCRGFGWNIETQFNALKEQLNFTFSTFP